MRMITLDSESFREFANNSPYKSFMQTPEIAKYRESNGWTVYYLGVEQEGQLKAATMLIAKPTFLGKSTFIAPGGPLMDLEDTELTNYFMRHLRQFIKSHNGYTLHITPNYELIERDRNGNAIKGGFNRTKAVQNLTKIGFRPIKSTQPQYSFAMDIEDRTPDQIFSDLKRNTRNHIRKAEKMGVRIRELSREELGVFKGITEATSHRRNFQDRPLSYYEQMYDLFHNRGEVQFILAEATIDNKLGAETPQTSMGKSPKCDQDTADETTGAISSSSQVVTPLSAAMFMTYGDEVIYLFSGSDENHMKEYNAQYLIQWHMIKYASNHHYRRYNFYGISGLPKDGNLDGIYDFKKGFTSGPEGHVIELIGAYELPINQPFYCLHRFLSKLRHH